MYLSLAVLKPASVRGVASITHSKVDSWTTTPGVEPRLANRLSLAGDCDLRPPGDLDLRPGEGERPPGDFDRRRPLLRAGENSRPRTDS